MEVEIDDSAEDDPFKTLWEGTSLPIPTKQSVMFYCPDLSKDVFKSDQNNTDSPFFS